MTAQTALKEEFSLQDHGGAGHPAAPALLGPGLAEHFVLCTKLGRYLTFQTSGRFLITDDFAAGRVRIPKDAQAMASICSKDELVARAALMPLAHRAAALDDTRREAYEELFELIERQTLSDRVREGAQAVLQSGFREVRIKELEAVLGDDLNPARQRYRQFLEVVRMLIDGQLAAGSFIDDFIDFTKSVAGRLDFGIYSFCLDRIFTTSLIPFQVKKLVAIEILNFPPLVRRELLSNALANAAVDRPVTDFIRHAIAMHLDKEQAVAIELLEGVKAQRITAKDIERTLARAANAANISTQAGTA
ncbi:MAG: hypothetical protein HQL36_05085 [Alphaproteobacteria bacterium]|nr:hypothetical protein [Alphaproteobacteria bacterium]MBF0250685.1 hypothetical protein [Alphaproteobacteria bacterium]